MPKTATLCLFLLFALLATALGGKLGGRTPITDVKNNKEIQQLGQYCVQEYNKGLTKEHQKKKGNGSDSAPLVFAEVVAAEKQVISGIKYYLKISATTAASSSGGVRKKFDAVVVVKPWAHSKELLNFSPSPSPATK